MFAVCCNCRQAPLLSNNLGGWAFLIWTRKVCFDFWIFCMPSLSFTFPRHCYKMSSRTEDEEKQTRPGVAREDQLPGQGGRDERPRWSGEKDQRRYSNTEAVHNHWMDVVLSALFVIKTTCPPQLRTKWQGLGQESAMTSSAWRLPRAMCPTWRSLTCPASPGWL